MPQPPDQARPLEASQHPQFSPLDLALLARAASSAAPMELRGVAESWHEELRPDHSLGTALLYDRILRRAESRTFLRRVIEGKGEADPSTWKIGIVPGAFFQEHPHTGADGERIRSLLGELGFNVERVPIRSFGRVTDNARIILDWLQCQTAPQVALISLSKGSAECRIALRISGGHGWEAVKTWVSLSGLAQGTPLIAWFRRRRLRMVGIRVLLWWRGQSFQAAEDLRHGDGELAKAWPKLPPHLRLVHVIGFPLAHHLRHAWAPGSVRRLSPWGPSDGGGFLLQDVAELPGIICPLWGVDHYLNPDWDASAFLRNLILAALSPAGTADLAEPGPS